MNIKYKIHDHDFYQRFHDCSEGVFDFPRDKAIIISLPSLPYPQCPPHQRPPQSS